MAVTAMSPPAQAQPPSTPSSNVSGTQGANGSLVPKAKNGSSRRIEIDNLVVEFQKKLGKNWDVYQVTVSMFLVGKLSRSELMEELDQILDKTTVRFHNQLLLTNLANSLRDEPLDGTSYSGFGNQQLSKKRKAGTKSSQYELLKKDILSLSIRERRRLKGIKRESGKRGMVNSVIALTRQAIVPKVPIVTNNESSISGNTSQWAQDVLDGFQTPLCSETYELPDKTHLDSRVLGIAREHGLVGPVGEGVSDVLSLGLEYHLKLLIERAMDMVRLRQPDRTRDAENSKQNSTITMTIEDLYDTLEMAPHLVEPNGALFGLSDNQLKNDDDVSLLQQQQQYLQRGSAQQKLSKISYLLKPQKTESLVAPASSSSTITAPASMPAISPSRQGERPANGAEEPPRPDSSQLQNGKPVVPETAASGSAPNLRLTDASIGLPNELNWLINDLLCNN
ncbi:hypothetical protein OGAPHI_005800 [Ogataea philodendri]|uniref:Transcriptional coactivator HFI1/ADA1 n=1 Tax=Ogataea philodendri TaxID=1378263 RepID=A0A9P8NZ27_9ASCO|nr:uncharacterized protein OGAPHI_005800 [Ogataea philodendri]KAH3662548.1 hypothetical protein OGAPHI_005800 [Ogataea philodendri]